MQSSPEQGSTVFSQKDIQPDGVIDSDDDDQSVSTLSSVQAIASEIATNALQNTEERLSKWKLVDIPSSPQKTFLSNSPNTHRSPVKSQTQLLPTQSQLEPQTSFSPPRSLSSQRSHNISNFPNIVASPDVTDDMISLEQKLFMSRLQIEKRREEAMVS